MKCEIFFNFVRKVEMRFIRINMKRVIWALLIFGSLLSSIECFAQKFQVKVVKISDGDTFVGLNRDNLQIKFRIWGIDAPEKKQAFGAKSKEYLSLLIFGKSIIVDVQGQDSWGRYLAYVYTPENKDVSYEMLRAGMAWHFVKYDDSESYRQAETEARNDKVGLWADPQRVAPWDFRRR